MSNAKQRTTLTNLNEPQQMRELNRQLSWIWDRLLGGLNLKSLSADARGVINSKVSSEDMESAIQQSADEILLEVGGIQIGGTQILKGTKALALGSGADAWRASDAQKVTRYENESGFYRLKLADSGQAADTWATAASPVMRLPDGWQGRQVTLSAWIWSEDWAGMDAGGQPPIAWALCLSKGTATRLNYGSKYQIVKRGEAALGSDAVSDTALANSKWTRVSVTWTLNAQEIASGSGVFAENTHVFVQFFLRRNGEYRIYAPKLEFGNRATDWTPHPDDPVQSVDAGGRVVIDQDGIRMSGGEIDMKTSDGSQSLHIAPEGISATSLSSPDVAPRYAGAAVLYVDPDATDAQMAAGNYFRSLADALSKINQRWLNRSLTINIAQGMTEYGTLQMRGISGNGQITVNGNGAKLVGQMNLYMLGVRTAISGLNVDVSAGGYGYDVGYGTVYASIGSCTITGSGTGWGIRSMHGAQVQASGCELYDLNRSLYVQYGGRLHGSANKGNSVAAASEGGFMTLTGTQPCHQSTWTAYKATCGQIFTDGVTVDQGDKPTVDPEPTTVTISAVTTDTWAPGVSSRWMTSWESSDGLRQGYTSSLGRMRACIWFDAAALKNKTIKQASMRLTRDGSHGASYGVAVKLYGTSMTADKTGEPTLTKAYGLVVANSDTDRTLGFVWNETESFTIPTAAVSDLAAGMINGLVLCADDEVLWGSRAYSRNYAQFIGVSEGTADTLPQMTVVYA